MSNTWNDGDEDRAWARPVEGATDAGQQPQYVHPQVGVPQPEQVPYAQPTYGNTPYGQPVPGPAQPSPQLPIGQSAYPGAVAGGMPVAGPVPRQLRSRPQLAVVTWTIIAVCLAVWLGEIMLPGFYEQVALSPALGESQPWRLLTSAFAHALTPMHIVFNMFALWSVGRTIELSLGRRRFAALYLLSALGGSVGFVLMASAPSASNPYGTNWYDGVIGASGAVFGLFGALLAMYRHLGVPMRSIFTVLALNAFISFTVPGIAWQAHVGGFLTGLVAGQLMLTAVKRTWQGKPDRTWPWMAGILAVLVLATIAKYALA